MTMFNEEIRNQLKELFKEMDKDVTMALFTKEEDCSSCQDTLSFLEELAATSSKLHLERYELEKDHALAEEYDVSLAPSIVILDSQNNYKRIKFNGIPAGHEINSLISSIFEVSGKGEDLGQLIMERLNKISNPIDIKVFVTLGCPHCPGAVSKAHKLAFENPNISASMIEAQTFAELSDQFNVSSVPKIVINDKYEFVGNQPFEVFLSEIEKAAAA